MRVRLLRTLAAIAALLVGALVSSSAITAQGAVPAGDAASGKTTFDRVGCWQCHGRQGQGGREGPRIASPVPMAWPALPNFVRTARRNMPPYTESVLSDKELSDIYAYLRSIPPAPDFTTIPLLNAMMGTARGQR